MERIGPSWCPRVIYGEASERQPRLGETDRGIISGDRSVEGRERLAQKKIKGLSGEELRQLINPAAGEFSVRRQCAILGFNRSTYYYAPVPRSAETVTLLQLLDQQYTATPFYGVNKMTQCLREQHYAVGKDRVRTLLRTMGLFAIYPRRLTSRRTIEHKLYPYLLTGMTITQPNQVWSADIT